MNIGIDIRPLMEAKRTGVGEYLFEFLEELFEKDKVNNYYLFYNSFKKVQVPKWNGKNIYYIKTSIPNKLFHLFQFLGLKKIDKIIEEQEAKIDMFFSANIHFTALSKNIPFFLTVHDLSFLYHPQFFNIKWRLKHVFVRGKRLAKRANTIFVPSKSTKEDLVRIWSLEHKKIQVTPLGLGKQFVEKMGRIKKKDLLGVSKKYKLPEQFCFYLGTIEPRKNIDGLIAAYELAGLNKKSVHLVIAGKFGWKYRKFKKAISKNPYIHAIGYADKKDLPALYKCAKVFVYPSFFEGFGLPPVEALSMGTPVIASKNSSFFEVLGNSARLINPYNITELSNALTEGIEKKKKVKNFRAEDFSWKKAVDVFLSELEKLK